MGCRVGAIASYRSIRGSRGGINSAGSPADRRALARAWGAGVNPYGSRNRQDGVDGAAGAVGKARGRVARVEVVGTKFAVLCG